MSQIDATAIRTLATGPDGHALQVDFRQSGDRIAHRVAIVGAAGMHLVLDSSEGDGDEPWPASPALQALNRDQLHAANCEFPVPAALVGMSGRSHWSLGIDPTEHDDRPALLFDVACRVKQTPPPGLGCSYCVLEATCLQINEAVRLVTAAGHVELKPLAVDPAGGDQSARIVVAKNRLSVHPVIAEHPTPPATLRWRYLLTLHA